MIHSGIRINSIYDQEIYIDFSKIPMFCGVIAITISSKTGKIPNLKKAILHVAENG